MQNNIIPSGPTARMVVYLSNNYVKQGIKTDINMANHYTAQKTRYTSTYIWKSASKANGNVNNPSSIIVPNANKLSESNATFMSNSGTIPIG
jgi:hypothetical protein